MSESSTRLLRRAAIGLTTAATVVALAAVTDTPASAAATKAFPGAVPSWATHANDAGTAPADTTVEYIVYLPLQDEAGAQAVATAVNTPGNSQYGHYLTPQQWIKTYSPTKKTLKQVEKYLKSEGYTITGVPKSRQYIVFRGPASAAQAAFGTTLHKYRFDGHTLVAPSSTPRLPSDIGKLVQGITLDTGHLLTRPALVSAGSPATASPKSAAAITPKATPNAAPKATPPVTATCSNYYGQHTATVPQAYGKTSYPTYLCGYLPTQLRSGYGLNKLISSGTNGQGQTVAIIDAYASQTIVKDTNDYMIAVGSPLLTTFKQIGATKPSQWVDQAACGYPSGWQTEETLDVQSAHSIAPGAKILYAGGNNCGGGLDLALSDILDNARANIVSNSYGYEGEAVPDDVLTGEQNNHIQAAAEGIGLYFSSGDNGDNAADLGYPSPDFDASSPFVTSVGGTSLAVDAKGSYQFETGWGSTRDQIVAAGGGLTYAQPLPGTFRGGAGGGTSAFFAQPAYQKGVVPDSLALAGGDGQPARVSPDVAALADPYTGFQIALRPYNDSTGTSGPLTYVTYGGTSLASPITAAQMALAQQLVGRQIGFANPALYMLDKAAPQAFNDVTPFNPPKALVFSSASAGTSYLVTLDRDTSLTTAPGYDDVTGLGSLKIGTLAQLIKNG